MTIERRMAQLLVLLMVLVCGSCSELAGPNVGRQSAHADFALAAPSEGLTQVWVDTRNGGVTILADSSARQIDIRGTKTAHAATRELSESKLKEIQVEARPDPDQAGRLRIRAVFPSSCDSCGVAFTIMLPPSLALKVSDVNGAVHITGTQRDASIQTSNASVELIHVNGNVEARTSNGGIVVRDLSGKLNAETMNARIDMERVRGKELSVGTMNGSIRCAAAQVDGPVSMRTANASIDAELESLPLVPQVKAVTSNGSISLAFPPTANARFHGRTHNGTITTDFHGTDHDGHMKGGELDIPLNGSLGLIEVQTANASARVRTLR